MGQGSGPSPAGLKHSHLNLDIKNWDLQVLVSNNHHHNVDDEVDKREPENELLTTSSLLKWVTEILPGQENG